MQIMYDMVTEIHDKASNLSAAGGFTVHHPWCILQLCLTCDFWSRLHVKFVGCEDMRVM